MAAGKAPKSMPDARASGKSDPEGFGPQPCWRAVVEREPSASAGRLRGDLAAGASVQEGLA